MNKNFTTLGYRPDFDTMSIILTKKFAKSASIVGSKDYNTLCRIRKDYPDYKVVVREIAKKEGKKNTHKNLTYKAMGAYIDTTIADDEAKKKALAEFENVKVLGKGQTCGAYLYVRDWFLKKYPKYHTLEEQTAWWSGVFIPTLIPYNVDTRLRKATLKEKKKEEGKPTKPER